MAFSQAELQQLLDRYNQMAGMRNMPWAIAGSAAQAVAGLQAYPNGPSPKTEPLVVAGMKVEDLIGWRIWRVKNGHLWSYTADYAWMPGEASEGDPGDHDSAGIWAFKDKRRAFQKAVGLGLGHVWGSVLLWGHVVEHADGYRASKARIISIGGATRDISREALADLCELHGVPTPQHVPLAPSLVEQKPTVVYGEQPPLAIVPHCPGEMSQYFPWKVATVIGGATVLWLTVWLLQ